ncbi:hypothetical protein TNCV_1123931 [Trichonephila clavipes]|uniref:Uncharacterized protein n=1 Tax=Trichonephila clavipes TaxID=2585209 RepID=A0A8X6SCX9_TRICX|nr:hypothetical protein TNCV_1123931 [Trichonephila clavipes]
MDLKNHSQGKRMTPEPASPILTSTPMGGRLSLDIFNVHRSISARRVFSGNRLELMIRRPRVRYLDHLATAAANIIKTRGRTTTKPTSENRSFQFSQFHSDAHPVTECKDQCSHSLLAARKRGSYQSKGSKRI